MTFEKPLFLTAYSTSLFSIYLLGFIVVPGWRRELRRSHRVSRACPPSSLPPRGIWHGVFAACFLILAKSLLSI